MRKTLLQTLLATFCAILAYTSLEGGGVMLIAARNAFMTGSKPTAKSYIQDGLVAMWDGIENAGWGVHDANATVWKDLVDGREFILPTGQYQITDNSIDMVRSASATFLRYYPDPVPVFTNMTIEAYAPPTSPSQSYTPSFSCLGRSITWGGNAADGYLGTQIVGSTQTNYRGNPAIAYGAITVCFSTNASDMKIYRNANAVAKAFRWSGNQTLNNRYSIGLPEIMKTFYYFRVYNRILTAEEIAANYAIDKARFNLPDAT